MSEPASGNPGGIPSDFFHNALHTLRTLELERVPWVGDRALSVGANGRWYFDWFEQCYGRLQRHVGIEAYEPRPDDLPANVQWIVNTADRMTDVEDAAVDVVFAGQTTEHLWADELTGFLLEAHRVLVPGGLLVIDSPNRLITSSLHWSHGGHTVELAAAEIVELLELAGFDVLEVRGLWSCTIGERTLELEEGLADPSILTRRIAEGPTRPDDSFVWWINARRGVREPRPDELERRVRQLFREHWEIRVSRGLMRSPEHRRLPIAAGEIGRIGETLPFVLHAGHWRVSLLFASGCPTDLEDLVLDVMSPGEFVQRHLPVASGAIEDDRVTWTFELDELIFALSIRLTARRTSSPVELSLPISIEAVGPASIVAARWGGDEPRAADTAASAR